MNTLRSAGSRDEMVARYLPLVRVVVGRLSLLLPPQVEWDELESYGLIGLLDAVDRFDSAKGLKFETYAYTRIRGAVLDGLRAQAWAPRLVAKAKQLSRSYGELEARLGRSPEDRELAEYLGISTEELAKLEAEAAAASLTSLDAESGEEGEALGSKLADDQAPDPLHHYLDDELREALATAIDLLPEKERTVVSLFYYEELTPKEIARAMGLTPARISQLHRKAILRLRGRLARSKAQLLGG